MAILAIFPKGRANCARTLFIQVRQSTPPTGGLGGLGGLAVSALADEIEAAVRRAFDAMVPRMVDEMMERIATSLAPGAALLDVDAAAQHLGLSSSTIYKLAERCELPSSKLGRRLVFRPADLDAYAEARKRTPALANRLAIDALKR
jgi:excisionase family DNA binding protein